MLLALLSLAGAEPTITAVGHEGRLTDEGIGWETQLVLRGWGLDEELQVELATPLEAAQLMGSDFGHMEPVLDEQGRVTALRLSELQARPGRLRIWSFQEGFEEGLRPPLVAGSLQRVELDGAGFEPETELGLQRHLRFTAQQGLQASERRGLDRRLDGRRRPGPGRHPVYLEGDARLARGLPGQLHPTGQVGVGLGLFVAALFGGVVLVLLAAHRLLSNLEARQAA